MGVTVKYGRITKVAVENLGAHEILRDTELSGFGVRSRANTFSYFVQKKVGGRRGRVQWITIGRHGSPWTAETARKRANQLLLELANGSDPAERKRNARLSACFDDVQKRFMEEYGPKLKPRTRTEYQRLLDNVITPRFRTRKMVDVERSDISKLHAGMSAVPARANFALSVLSRVFSWAEENGYELADGNPCRKIAKYRLGKRERYLTADEYQRLGAAITHYEGTGELGTYTAAALRVLLLTGARLNEILTLKWVYVRLDKECLFLPDSKTGEKVIRLGKAAMEVLGKIPRVEGNPYVMVGHLHGTHLVNLHKSWNLVRTKAGLGEVRIHDLRHSFASVAADSGASLPMIGGLLGHAEPQTTARYVHLVDRRLHELNQRVDGVIGSALSSRPTRKGIAKRSRKKSAA